jgi:hypothetical protein
MLVTPDAIAVLNILSDIPSICGEWSAVARTAIVYDTAARAATGRISNFGSY